VAILPAKLALETLNAPLISEAICAELEIKVLPNSDSAVANLVDKLELVEVKAPLTSAAIANEPVELLNRLYGQYL
jgi:hypothetical protein